jgi:uncharacterized protein (TIGR02145 family)
MYGKFITNSAMATVYDWHKPQYDRAWRNRNDGLLPCPSGWKVPSSSDLSTLYRSGATWGSQGGATSNTWIWKNKGYAIQPDGATTTLFLPAAGYRTLTTGNLTAAGINGIYWTCNATSGGAYSFNFFDGAISPDTHDWRAYGFSLRCLAE